MGLNVTGRNQSSTKEVGPNKRVLKEDTSMGFGPWVRKDAGKDIYLYSSKNEQDAGYKYEVENQRQVPITFSFSFEGSMNLQLVDHKDSMKVSVDVAPSSRVFAVEVKARVSRGVQTSVKMALGVKALSQDAQLRPAQESKVSVVKTTRKVEVNTGREVFLAQTPSSNKVTCPKGSGILLASMDGISMIQLDKGGMCECPDSEVKRLDGKTDTKTSSTTHTSSKQVIQQASTSKTSSSSTGSATNALPGMRFNQVTGKVTYEKNK